MSEQEIAGRQIGERDILQSDFGAGIGDHHVRAHLIHMVRPQILEAGDPRGAAEVDDIMRGADFLDAARYPEISFRSTLLERTGPNTARVTGELTLHGVTRPVALDVRFNGGYAGMELDPNARVGFSARGVFNRSDFGMAYGIPPEGSNMGVGDAVEVIIETEFSGPAWAPVASHTRVWRLSSSSVRFGESMRPSTARRISKPMRSSAKASAPHSRTVTVASLALR